LLAELTEKSFFWRVFIMRTQKGIVKNVASNIQTIKRFIEESSRNHKYIFGRNILSVLEKQFLVNYFFIFKP